MVKRLMMLGLLSSTGCFDFSRDLEQCHADGGCTRPGMEADGGTVSDGGAVSDAGTSDGGGTPFSTTPVFTTETGWGWEFPFPAGPGLHSIAAVSDDELWALGDDDALLHYAQGKATFSRLTNGSGRNGAVVRLNDGGVMLVAGQEVWLNGTGTWTRARSFVAPFNAVSSAVSAGGAAWFGGEYQASSGPCAPAGAGIFEWPQALPQCTTAPGRGRYVIGLDPQGWALDNDGGLFQHTDAGWRVVGAHPNGYYNVGDVLELSPDRVLISGSNGGVALFDLDAGSVTALTFERMGHTDQWSSLVLAQSPSDFFATGSPGVLKCSRADPTLCTPEFEDVSDSLVQLDVAPHTAFAVGDNGQLIQRVDAGDWRVLLPGGLGKLHDLWQDESGELWVVGDQGLLLHRTSAGWERVDVGNETRDIHSITRTDDGVLWLSGAELLSSYDPESHSLIPADVTAIAGGSLPLPGSGVDLGALSGTKPGNTWAGGIHTLLRYDANRQWVEVSLPVSFDLISDVFATGFGTAWAVGGFTKRTVLFFDGTTWVDRSPNGTGPLTSVWGPNANEAFVQGELSGYHYLADGGGEPWDLLHGAWLAGAVNQSDGGYVLFAAMGTQFGRARNGLGGTLSEIAQPAGRFLNRMRLRGNRVFVLGARDDPRSFVLSLDAGL